MHVLVLQHVASEGPGRIADALTARGISVRVIRIDRGEPVPTSLDGARGLIVMGGPMGVYEADRFPHLRDEIALIRAAHGVVPVLGICLGSQLVAAALGASVKPSGTLELGWLPITVHAADPLLELGTFVALCWHGDVFDLPPGAVALASSAMTPLQAFRHGRTWGLLFHVEADVAAMADAFPGDLARAGLTRDALVTEPAELPTLAATIFDRWAVLV